MTSESELFISELPDNKKIKTYARQKPIRLKRHLTVGVEYEDLFTNGKKQPSNVDTKEKRQRSTLKEITNTVKNERKGTNYRRTKRRDGLQRLLKEKNQEIDLVKQVTGCNKSCKDNEDGSTSAMLNAAEKVLDQKANGPAGKNLSILEAVHTGDQDAIISSNKDYESTEVNCFPLFVDTISSSSNNSFILPTTSTPIQREKDRKVTDFNFECTPIVSSDNQRDKSVKLNEYNLQTPIEKTDRLNEHILQTPLEKTHKLNEYLQTPVEKTHKLNKHILQAPVQDKEIFTCLLVAPLTTTPTVEINSINTISHVVRIKKLSCVPLDVLIL